MAKAAGGGTVNTPSTRPLTVDERHALAESLNSNVRYAQSDAECSRLFGVRRRRLAMLLLRRGWTQREIKKTFKILGIAVSDPMLVAARVDARNTAVPMPRLTDEQETLLDETIEGTSCEYAPRVR